MMKDCSGALKYFAPGEIRDRAHRVLQSAEDGKLRHVSVDLARLDAARALVMAAIEAAYPDMQIPPYGLWRDLEAGGIDRWGALAGARGFEGPMEMLASAADLAIVASIMRTRHPVGWVFQETTTGETAQGKQAAALAAFAMFAAGSFSADPMDPFRVDAQALIRMDRQEIAQGLQWDLEADAEFIAALQDHLKRFGEAMALRPDLFATGMTTRPGLLATRLAEAASEAGEEGVAAPDLIDDLLSALAPVWQGGAFAKDVGLGDCFSLSSAMDALPDTIMPFQLPAQDIVYSLVEPLAWAGFALDGLDLLTAPGDLEHVALFARTGVLTVDAGTTGLDETQAQDRAIEVRAVTMALVDRLADQIRQDLDVTGDHLPLTCILEGGTHRAGKKILCETPPENAGLGTVLNPGNVFWLLFGA